MIPFTPPCMHTTLGFAYLEHGDTSNAQKEFRGLLGRNHGYLMARLGLAGVAIVRDFEGALKQLEEAWEIDQRFVKANANYLLQEVEPQKIGSFGKWIEFPARESALTHFLALSIKKLAEPREGTLDSSAESEEGFPARRDRASPPSQPDRLSLAQLYAQGRYTECTQRLRANRHESPSDLLVGLECAYYSGDYRTSFAVSGKLLKEDGSVLAALYWRARTAATRASEALTRAATLNPDSPKTHILLGDSFLTRDRLSDAQSRIPKSPGDRA